MSFRACVVFARFIAKGTLGRSGWDFALNCSTITTSPVSSSFLHVDRKDCHELLRPPTSLLLNARRIGAVPLYPDTTWIGRPRGTSRNLGGSWVPWPAWLGHNLTC